MGAGPVLIEHIGLPWEHRPAEIVGKNGKHYFVQTEDGDVVKVPCFGHSLLPGVKHPRYCGQVHGAYRGTPVPILLRLAEEIGWVLQTDYNAIAREMA